MKLSRVALALEVTLCFLPLLVALVSAVGATPAALIGVLAGNAGLLFYVVLVSAAVAGMFGVSHVLRWLIGRPARLIGRRWVLALLSIGAIPLLLIAVLPFGFVVRSIVIAPLICGLHLVYLAREYLFPRSAPERA